MRRAQKKQAEDFVKLLSEAHGEIKAAIEKKNFSAAQGLLADCQDGAIALGNLIEAAEGEGFATISLLESYCETVYHAHEELERGQAVSVSKIYKALRQSLYRIESSVKNDIKVRLEAVFLPYKASMWDSLESIWKAADEDPDCDAYVIPIPYYDKNPDGSFREMHYEGGEYPKDVPVVWYEDYGLVKEWQAHITRYFYDCTEEILAGLGELYVADERFHANIDRFGPGTAQFLSAAIAAYCKK